MKLLPNNIDIQRCAAVAGNRFDLILIAAARVRELNHGHRPHIQTTHKPAVTALEEIQLGHVGRDMLRRVGARRGK